MASFTYVTKHVERLIIDADRVIDWDDIVSLVIKADSTQKNKNSIKLRAQGVVNRLSQSAEHLVKGE